ncbi:MAG: antibiotic biosynthesis monooxygenase [Gammaproteobacteria bacterium]|nr:MAG: antibiotic biosynthesis monooxygenase [Gammaproteobacteria bacterium]
MSEQTARMSFISRMTVKSEKEAEFIRLAKALTEKVHAHEPDTLIYQFYRLREPHRFAVVESFTSEQAEHEHQNTEHFKALAPGLVDCLDGPYVREYLDPLEP